MLVLVLTSADALCCCCCRWGVPRNFTPYGRNKKSSAYEAAVKWLNAYCEFWINKDCSEQWQSQKVSRQNEDFQKERKWVGWSTIDRTSIWSGRTDIVFLMLSILCFVSLEQSYASHSISWDPTHFSKKMRKMQKLLTVMSFVRRRMRKCSKGGNVKI